MITTFLLFIIGLTLVVVGADYFIAGSSLIAKRFNIPKLIIGLTIVAIGTSAPELAINVTSSLGGHNDLALGNILGSNISNILLIFAGASLFVKKITISKNSLYQIIISVGVSLVVTLVAFVGIGNRMQISSTEGVLLFFLGFIYWFSLYKITKSNDERLEDDDIEDNKLKKIHSLWVVAGITMAGLAILLYGSNLVTDAAVTIATTLGIPELIISGTVIAVGTSLPELVTSIQAVRQKQYDLMIGNIIGSNIVNSLFVLGASAIISPLVIHAPATFYLFGNILVALLVLLAFIIFEKRVFTRWQSIIFLLLYVFFLIYNFW